MENDIAVLKLSEEFEFTVGVQPACLPPPTFKVDLKAVNLPGNQKLVPNSADH